MEKTIIVENLVKKYKKADRNAVDNISFYVEEGSYFAFLGPNGAGKTTTISILTTTLAKTSGKVTISGFDLDNNQSEVRKNIGVIFQNPSLDLNLTGEENIRFHAFLYGLYSFNPFFNLMPKEYKDKVSELGDVIGLGNEIFKPLRTFSGGMKRKLEIIRTLMHKPKILFLDEPTSGLDPASRKSLWKYLKEIRSKEKTTIFLTTHYLEEAEGADYLYIINNGKIVSSGTPANVKESLIDEYMSADILEEEKLKLENELKELKLNYHFLDTDSVRINLRNQSVQRIIKTVESRMINIKIVRPTLEEAYLQIIERDEKNK